VINSIRRYEPPSCLASSMASAIDHSQRSAHARLYRRPSSRPRGGGLVPVTFDLRSIEGSATPIVAFLQNRGNICLSSGPLHSSNQIIPFQQKPRSNKYRIQIKDSQNYDAHRISNAWFGIVVIKTKSISKHYNRDKKISPLNP
jgi:hypothetical protein